MEVLLKHPLFACLGAKNSTLQLKLCKMVIQSLNGPA